MYPIERVEDLPTFFVLVYALHRFTITDWAEPWFGRASEAGTCIGVGHRTYVRYEPTDWPATIGMVFVMFKQNKLYSALTLTGRGTRIV